MARIAAKRSGSGFAKVPTAVGGIWHLANYESFQMAQCFQSNGAGTILVVGESNELWRRSEFGWDAAVDAQANLKAESFAVVPCPTDLLTNISACLGQSSVSALLQELSLNGTVQQDQRFNLFDLDSGKHWCSGHLPMHECIRILPEQKWLIPALGAMLILLMAGLGATMDRNMLIRVFRRPKGFFVGLVSQFLFMPFLGYVLSVALEFHPDPFRHKYVALSLILVCATPGGSTSNMYTYFSSGDTPLSVCMTVVATLVGLVMMPVNVNLYGSLLFEDSKNFGSPPISEIVKSMGLVLVPTLFGMVLRSKNRVYAGRLTTIGSVAGVLCIVVIICAGLADPKNQAMLRDVGWQIYFVAVIVGFAGMLFGYCVSRLLFLQPRTARTVSFETGIQNVPLTVAVIAFSFQKDRCAIFNIEMLPILYGLFVSIISPLALFWYVKALGSSRENLAYKVPSKYAHLTDRISSEGQTIMKVYTEICSKYGGNDALMTQNPTTKSWSAVKHSAYYAGIERVGRAFIGIGLEKNMGVAIMSFNRKEWFFANNGCIWAGAHAVGIYLSNSPLDCQYIVHNADCQIVVVENEKLLARFLEISHDLPYVKAIVVMDPFSLLSAGKSSRVVPTGSLKLHTEDGRSYVYRSKELCKGKPCFENAIEILTWEEMWKMGSPKAPNFGELNRELKKRVAAARPEDVASLIYTSGTTGKPKGVMLTHDNITYTAILIGQTCACTPVDEFVSYLPLSHIAEQCVTMYIPMFFGQVTWFAQPDALKGSLVATFKAARPTILFGVPRVYEKIQAKLQSKAGQPLRLCWTCSLGQWSADKMSALSAWAKKRGLEYGYAHQIGKEHTIKNPFWPRELVWNPIKSALGLDRCRLVLSGAAPISLDTLEYFMQFGINICEVYGMTEVSGGSAFGLPMPLRYKTGTVGTPITECRIFPDGEIGFKGRNVMLGYYKDPDRTKETLDSDGWLHTGDIGHLDENGFLKITDRKKNLIITAGGENVAPVIIENLMMGIKSVESAVVFGDRQKFLTMIVTLDPENCFSEAAELGVNYDAESARCVAAEANEESVSRGSNNKALADLSSDPIFFKHIWDQVESCNKNLPRVQQIKKIKILSQRFTNEGAAALLTPTLKIKRRMVYREFISVFKDMYREDYVPNKFDEK